MTAVLMAIALAHSVTEILSDSTHFYFPSTMSQSLDPFLDYLDRYEAQLDATGEQLKLKVDQKILELKQDVNHLRNHILGISTQGLPLSNDPLPSAKAVNFEVYHTSRRNDHVDPAPSLDDTVPRSSTSRKRKRASKPSRKDRKRPQANPGDDDESDHDGEDINSGAFKVKVIKLNCPEGCQGLALQTREQYHDHLNKQHGLLRYMCLHRGCAQRFRYL